MLNTLEFSSLRIIELGRVRSVKRNIATVTGLSHFMNGQLVEFANSTKGMIVGFRQEDILVLILGDEAGVRIGQEVYSHQDEFKLPVGKNFIGRLVNALAEPIDGKGEITPCEYYPVFRSAPITMDRGEVSSYLETGTKIIDCIIPIARGQRQLIIGDRMTGKTTICCDAILNQKNKDVICIYCCIGKSYSAFLRVVQLLKSKGALDYTIIVAAGASSTVVEQYLVAYTATIFGEYFMYQGQDSLVVFDDLTKHAWSYRQLSLLLERPPGREAYPGDIYYIHSQLIERAGKLSRELGSGSLTFLPIVDTLQGDVTGYIPSNLISMTDGSVYLDSTLFAEGMRPAIDFGASVSIIGTKIQNPVLKELSAKIRLEYMQYKEILRLTKLKTDLTASVQQKIHQGQAISILLAQDKNAPVSAEELIVLLYALDRKILNELDVSVMQSFKNEIWQYINKDHSALVKKLQGIQELSFEVTDSLDKIFVEYFKQTG